MAFSQYDRFLKEHVVINDTEESKAIKSIGKQIAAAAQTYFEYKGLPHYFKRLCLVI